MTIRISDAKKKVNTHSTQKADTRPKTNVDFIATQTQNESHPFDIRRVSDIYASIFLNKR